MPCFQSGGVTVCQPRTTWIRKVRVCPCCGERHRIIGMSQEWYDTIWTCCGCGDAWAGGELLPRPFRPGWRDQARAEARRNWRASLLVPREEG